VEDGGEWLALLCGGRRTYYRAGSGGGAKPKRKKERKRACVKSLGGYEKEPEDYKAGVSRGKKQ